MKKQLGKIISNIVHLSCHIRPILVLKSLPLMLLLPFKNLIKSFSRILNIVTGANMIFHPQMSAEHNVYIAKLESNTSKWQLLSTFLFIVCSLLIFTTPKNLDKIHNKKRIVRISINGPINSSPEYLKSLQQDVVDKIIQDTSIIGVIVRIDSPGGSVTPSEMIYKMLSDIRTIANKPIIAVVDGVAASGGYITALACDAIILHETSVIGSIGTLSIRMIVREAMNKIGIKAHIMRSAKFKATGNPFEEPTKESLDLDQSHIMQVTEWFKDIVKNRRGMSKKEIDDIADGRIFIGKDAVDHNLADYVGREKDAISLIKDMLDIDESILLPIDEINVKKSKQVQRGFLRNSLIDNIINKLSTKLISSMSHNVTLAM